MEQKGERKTYTREFKLAAVKMSQESGRTVAQVARELDIRENDLHAWRNTINEHGDNAFPGRGKRPKSDLSELKRENERLKEENDILKKAAIFFAKETGKNSSL
jgi:transposase